MTIRKLFFWMHLIAGSIAGTVILIMSLTGVLLTYEKQITAWADHRGYGSAPRRSGASRMSVEALIARVRDARNATPSTVTLRNDPDSPAVFAFGRDNAVLADAFTGEILGEGSRGVRAFFRAVTDWHRWLGADGRNRAAARAVTGACNLAFLFLVMSGLYLWWPSTWTRQTLRAVTWFRGGLSGKARDFNWHNVIGFWCCVPLFFIVLSGVVMSYPWANNLVYRLGGSTPPAQGMRPGAGCPERGKATELRGARPTEQPGSFNAPPLNLSLHGIDRLWNRAEEQVAGWRSISLRLPASERAPLTFTIDEGGAGQPQKRSTLTLSRATGEIVRLETFSSLDAGRRLRVWLRFVHTGEYYGWVGQTLAGIASLGG